MVKLYWPLLLRLPGCPRMNLLKTSVVVYCQWKTTLQTLFECYPISLNYIVTPKSTLLFFDPEQVTSGDSRSSPDSNRNYQVTIAQKAGIWLFFKLSPWQLTGSVEWLYCTTGSVLQALGYFTGERSGRIECKMCLTCVLKCVLQCLSDLLLQLCGGYALLPLLLMVCVCMCVW